MCHLWISPGASRAHETGARGSRQEPPWLFSTISDMACGIHSSHSIRTLHRGTLISGCRTDDWTLAQRHAIRQRYQECILMSWVGIGASLSVTLVVGSARGDASCLPRKRRPPKLALPGGLDYAIWHAPIWVPCGLRSTDASWPSSRSSASRGWPGLREDWTCNPATHQGPQVHRLRPTPTV